jgi:hypothetical protein
VRSDDIIDERLKQIYVQKDKVRNTKWRVRSPYLCNTLNMQALKRLVALNMMDVVTKKVPETEP